MTCLPFPRTYDLTVRGDRVLTAKFDVLNNVYIHINCSNLWHSQKS